VNAHLRRLENSTMKPTRLVLAFAILAGLLSAQAAGTSPRASNPTKSGKPRKVRPVRPAQDTGAPETIAPADPLRNQAVMNGLIDSLRRAAVQSSRRAADSARRFADSAHHVADSSRDAAIAARHAADSTAKVARSSFSADSVRRVGDSLARIADSTRRVTDSVRRADSTVAARRTWYVALPQGRMPLPQYAQGLRERLVVELRRTGRVRPLTGIDTGSWRDGIWPTARASGAGKLLATTIATDSSGRIACMVRLYDIARAKVVDSLRLEAPGSAAIQTRTLAHRTIASFLPSAQDSACRADSLRTASIAWTIETPRCEMRDTSLARALGQALTDSVRKSPWARLASPRSPGSDSSNQPSESAVSLQSRLGRQSDSAWFISARLVRGQAVAAFDSLLVTSSSIDSLAARLSSQLLRPPATCRTSCLPSTSREVWSVSLQVDSSLRQKSSEFDPVLKSAFRSRTDRQFLSLASGSDPRNADSISRSLGATRHATARLSGADPLWTLDVRIHDQVGGKFDTLVLQRGGPLDRIFPWFARHLAAYGAPAEACPSACRADSIARAARTWAVMPPPGADSFPVGAAMAKALRERGRGRLDTLRDSSGCASPLCVDSLAAARSIERVVWPQLSRRADSSWLLEARIADMASDTWTDSVSLRDTGSAPDALNRIARRFWEKADPIGRCDSCVSTDTLEAALAIPMPSRWQGAPDSLRAPFRDSLVGVFSREGRFQILDTTIFAKPLREGATDKALRCRTGAAFLLGYEASLEQDGWVVKASLVELATDRVAASLEYHDKNRRPDRPSELAPWVARRLLGTETRTEAPSSKWDLPWTKILRLGIPAAIGITSVLLHL